MTTSREIAAFLDVPHRGPETPIVGVDALDAAGPEEFAFCIYEDPAFVHDSRAGAIVCPPSIGPIEGRTLLFADDPKLAFVRAVRGFFSTPIEETTVHPTAVVAAGATIGDRTRVGPHVYVDDRVEIGDDCTVRAGAAIGGEGFGFARDDADELHRQPHHGRVRIGDEVDIGPNTSIDRAVFDETAIGRGTKLSGQVHLAHQVTIGEHTTVACGAGMAGGVAVGDRVTVHPHVSIATDVRVGDDAELGMNAGVLNDVPDGATVVGTPARPIDH